jgi:hypothetical protein
MTGDRRLISFEEMKELEDLEKTFSKKEMTKRTSLTRINDMVFKSL